MTREEYDRAIENITAARDGKTLLTAGGRQVECPDRNSPEFLSHCTIKPEPRWRPWTETERLQKVIDRQVVEYDGTVGVLGVDDEDYAFVGGQSVGWNVLFADGKQLPSGERCGVLE